MEYKRYDMETDEELIFRVCSEKDMIGSWQKVADILNELLNTEYTESKFRKQFQSFQKMLEANQSKFVDSKAQLEEIKLQTEMLKRERIKLQTAQIADKRYLRHDSRFELFYERFADAKEYLEQPKLKRVEIKENAKAPVLGISDLHFGADFEVPTNKYSRKECKNRFEKLLSYMEEYIEKEGLSSIQIINTSDTLQGILRLSDLQINDIAVVDALVEVSRLLAHFLNELSASCKIKYYHVSEANHTQIRSLGSKAGELGAEDLEKVIINYVSDLLMNNDRVEVISNIGRDYVDVDILGINAFASHGHKIKNKQSCINDMSNRNQKFYQIAFLGHTHSANETIVGEYMGMNKEVLTIPSFIGTCPYSDSLMLGAKGMAKIFEFDEVYGHVGSKNIILN